VSLHPKYTEDIHGLAIRKSLLFNGLRVAKLRFSSVYFTWVTIRELMAEQRARARSGDVAERFAAALLIPCLRRREHSTLAQRVRVCCGWD
jgi:hypothetical protein